jgi:Tol biopolymer transport system component
LLVPGRRTGIAFVSDRDGSGNWKLYVMGSDGTNQWRLTNPPEDEAMPAWYLAVPAWSPDGEKIAYATDVGADPSIWVMDADGSDRTRLTDGNWPSWFPDGERSLTPPTTASGPTSP